VNGPGIRVESACAAVESSQVLRTRGSGIVIGSSISQPGPIAVAVNNTAVYQADGACISIDGGGDGFTGFAYPQPTLELRGVLAQDCVGMGVRGWGTDVHIASSVIRHVKPDPREGASYGIDIERSEAFHLGANLTLTSSIIEDGGTIGVRLSSVDQATLEGVTVHGAPTGAASDAGAASCTSHQSDFGIWATNDAGVKLGDGGIAPTVTISHSVVEGAHVAGVQVEGAPVRLESTIVRNTFPVPGCYPGFADAVVAYSPACAVSDCATPLKIDGLFVDGAARAGVALFGQGEPVSLGNVAIQCAPQGLLANLDATPFAVEDPSSVVCGCGGNVSPCKSERSSAKLGLLAY
jgi:hypothetical protein